MEETGRLPRHQRVDITEKFVLGGR